MSQTISDRESLPVKKDYMNVPENWVLFDTVLIGEYTGILRFNQGYFLNYLTCGGATSIPFFNVRNRNHGLAYNNQDTRDQLAWVFKIFTVGVQFFSPSTMTWNSSNDDPIAPDVTESNLWETELPKHASLTITTNQDQRLKINSLMTPSGAGPIGGGLSAGNFEATNALFPNVAKWTFCQGIPMLTNKWGFPNPLDVPRRAALSAQITFSEYGRNLLQNMAGPRRHFFRNVDTPPQWYNIYAMSGIRIVLGGQRQIQQRGQYHA